MSRLASPYSTDCYSDWNQTDYKPYSMDNANASLDYSLVVRRLENDLCLMQNNIFPIFKNLMKSYCVLSCSNARGWGRQPRSRRFANVSTLKFRIISFTMGYRIWTIPCATSASEVRYSIKKGTKPRARPSLRYRWIFQPKTRSASWEWECSSSHCPPLVILPASKSF